MNSHSCWVLCPWILLHLSSPDFPPSPSSYFILSLFICAFIFLPHIFLHLKNPIILKAPVLKPNTPSLLCIPFVLGTFNLNPVFSLKPLTSSQFPCFLFWLCVTFKRQHRIKEKFELKIHIYEMLIFLTSYITC